MNNTTEIQNHYKEIADKLIGYTKTDFEDIFKNVICPIYTSQCTIPNLETNYKIVDRETGEEVINNSSINTLKELGFF